MTMLRCQGFRTGLAVAIAPFLATAALTRHPHRTIRWRNHRVILSLALNLVLLGSPFTAKPTAAQPAASNCEAALTANRKRLTTGRNLTVRVERRDLAESYPDYPSGRNHQYFYSIKGAAATSVMESNPLLTAIAQDTIKNCPTAGITSIGIANTGYVGTFGWFPGGQVKPFECLEPGRSNRRPSWGKQYCT
jgi:hypothetical protein